MTAAKRFPKPPALSDRWWLRVDRNTSNGCWEWIGAKWARGYGIFTLPRTQRRTAAHRWGYEHLVGPVPEGLDLDHLCRNRSCVNPAHLEPVTRAENVRRGLARYNGQAQRAKTACPAGHPYDEANTYIDHRGHRKCRKCNADQARRRKALARAQRNAAQSTTD